MHSMINILNPQAILHPDAQWGGRYDDEVFKTNTDQTKCPKRSHLSGRTRITNATTTKKFRRTERRNTESGVSVKILGRIQDLS